MAQTTADDTSAPAPPLVSPYISDGWFGPFLVILAVTFNALLSFINGHVTQLSTPMVIAFEGAILLGAHYYAVTHYRPAMSSWYIFTFLILLFAVGRMLTLGEFDPKFFRDFFIIPTFVVFGMIISKRRVLQTMIILHVMVSVGVLWELLALEHYANTLEIKKYYIDTRGLEEDQFWNRDSKLYISATRPFERIFPFFDMHRMSSLYLEPVSLGNHVILMTAVIMTFWFWMSSPMRYFMIAANILCLFACDGRLAISSSILLILVTIFWRRIPTNFGLVLLPASILLAVVSANLFGFSRLEDDFPGRIAHTAWLIDILSFADVMGVSNDLLWPANDSGAVYLMMTQSLVGVAAIWLLIVFTLEEKTREQKVYKNCLCVYLCLTMLVSYSFVSIKTAAPLWMIYGALVGVKAPVLSQVIMGSQRKVGAAN